VTLIKLFVKKLLDYQAKEGSNKTANQAEKAN